ncbi:gluconate 2-dehydrogenase subunit 3 family protein [Occallatibacter riparius]|uniref:Gluconate 2-dehydrogenase subunit 3 family protein n=1 Tax=Occallatibacter riparius TaxID=1002689 RepID=A0A9J7BNF4_9BACT|nr:gluconate 2-dehydrogenase subunit 3 family protein [Occallatibacter riparius]UWZ82701.1 gluconate 2-dehydrogenase subunit 3 family protein [Occallatibacter riparius]
MFNRREILIGAAAASTALLSGCHSPGSTWLVFTDDQARTLTALCDQIIPADDWSSASQAGVLTFIDRQLTGPYRRHRTTYRQGIEATEKLCHDRFGLDLTAAMPTQQLEIAKALEHQNSAFFALVRTHTMQGYYGSPRHGGNKDAVSYRMLGLDYPLLRGRAQYDFTAGPKS